MTKTVLITGATKGIGLATSLKFKNLGYKVVGIARNESSTFPGVLFNCDLNDSKAAEEVLMKIKNQFNIDIIVNNVSISLPEQLGEINTTALSKVYDLTVRTAVQVTQAFVADMKSKNYGKIINISSRAILGSKCLSSYVAAKSALVGLTRVWALELAPFRITANVVAPGFIDAGLLILPSGMSKDGAAKVTPLGRIGTPDDVASVINFLASDEAGFITGQTLYVDGGRSLSNLL